MAPASGRSAAVRATAVAPAPAAGDSVAAATITGGRPAVPGARQGRSVAAPPPTHRLGNAEAADLDDTESHTKYITKLANYITQFPSINGLADITSGEAKFAATQIYLTKTVNPRTACPGR